MAEKRSKKSGDAENLHSPELYVNRELSWLEFNHRVLHEGTRADVPPLERLKFLAITGSNLDEFFMVRVAGLVQARQSGLRRKDTSGMTPAAQLKAIRSRVLQMYADHAVALADVVEILSAEGVHLLRRNRWDENQREYLRDYFHREVLPVITPLAVEQMHPKPLLSGLRLNLAAAIEPEREDDQPQTAIVSLPRPLPRFITIPAEKDLHLAFLEDVLAENAAAIFGGRRVLATSLFRITRDSDLTVDEDEAGDLLESMEEVISQRKRRGVVRLEISASPDKTIKRSLINMFEVGNDRIYEISGMLGARDLMDITTRPGLDRLKYEDWPPQQPLDMLEEDDPFEVMAERDVMLYLPYEKFDPVIRLLQQAADDPQTLAIKMTLYRTTGDSPIIEALMRAADSGKQVTVLVELKARFDEARNVEWARALEDVGCDVIYGVAGLKTHAKCLLIIRRQKHGIRRYLQLSTGNYNEKTARLYSDIAIMTTDRETATDVANFFNLLTGYSQPVDGNKIHIAPMGLKQRFIDLIEREIQSSTREQPGLIMAKVNSLECPDICRALYRAGRAGVKVMLNVRGICCLRPGVEGVSDNIEVRSIIDRYLEHARMYYFRNAGREEVYLSSADWMIRNLQKRLEILFPVLSQEHKNRLIGALKTYFADNVKAHRMLPDGGWQPLTPGKKRIRAQEELYKDAVEVIQASMHARLRFHPQRKRRGDKLTR